MATITDLNSIPAKHAKKPTILITVTRSAVFTPRIPAGLAKNSCTLNGCHLRDEWMEYLRLLVSLPICPR